MADPDRLNNLKEKVARLEDQLTRSEKMLEEIRKRLKSSQASAQEESDERSAKLEKDLEDQREEFEALIGRMNEELQAMQKERDELVLELEKSRPKKKHRAAFEDEPTSTYSHQEIKDVVKREMFVAEEEPFFEEEEVTATHTIGQPPGGKDQDT
jgi:chromosome segregation ATPase